MFVYLSLSVFVSKMAVLCISAQCRSWEQLIHLPTLDRFSIIIYSKEHFRRYVIRNLHFLSIIICTSTVLTHINTMFSRTMDMFLFFKILG